MSKKEINALKEQARAENRQLWRATAEFNGKPRNARRWNPDTDTWTPAHTLGESGDRFADSGASSCTLHTSHQRGTIRVHRFYFLL